MGICRFPVTVRAFIDAQIIAAFRATKIVGLTLIGVGTFPYAGGSTNRTGGGHICSVDIGQDVTLFPFWTFLSFLTCQFRFLQLFFSNHFCLDNTDGLGCGIRGAFAQNDIRISSDRAKCPQPFQVDFIEVMSFHSFFNQ